MKKHLFIISLVLAVYTGTYAHSGKDTIKLADPTIFHDGNMYYLYGTGSRDGFAVYTSTDLVNWNKQKKNALLKGDSYGTRGFWAPQIFKHQGKYYMAYTADEHIAIAEGSSPLGPFKQVVHKSISEPGRQIDPFIFKDVDGKLYLYHVRLQNGNRIFVTRLKDDLSDINGSSVTECIHAEQGWENTANAKWPVTEGPTMIRMDNLYYMFYSANDFRNIDYAVGYATSLSPLGPWIKHNGNPILSRKNTGQNGSGHGDLFAENNGSLSYVFHTHNSNTNVNGARKTAIIGLSVSKESTPVISVTPATFRYLEIDNSSADATKRQKP
jgi:xylan 1,4-beta-xylosidase